MKSTYNKKFICSKCSETKRIVWRIIEVLYKSKTHPRLRISIVCRGCNNIVDAFLEPGSYDTSLLDDGAPTTYTQDSEEAAYWEKRPSAWEANGCPALSPTVPTVGWPSP